MTAAAQSSEITNPPCRRSSSTVGWTTEVPTHLRHGEIQTMPSVLTPTALKARLEAQHALRALPRHLGGIAAAARSTLARIVACVEQRILPQEAAAEQL